MVVDDVGVDVVGVFFLIRAWCFACSFVCLFVRLFAHAVRFCLFVQYVDRFVCLFVCSCLLVRLFVSVTRFLLVRAMCWGCLSVCVCVCFFAFVFCLLCV